MFCGITTPEVLIQNLMATLSAMQTKLQNLESRLSDVDVNIIKKKLSDIEKLDDKLNSLLVNMEQINDVESQIEKANAIKEKLEEADKTLRQCNGQMQWTNAMKDIHPSLKPLIVPLESMLIQNSGLDVL